MTDQAEQSERNIQTVQNNQTDQPNQTDQAKHSNQNAQANQADQNNQNNQTNQPNQADQNNQAKQPKHGSQNTQTFSSNETGLRHTGANAPHAPAPRLALPGDLPRCSWADTPDDSMRAYHDTEWGLPCHDDTGLFELLSLEIMQAGLSWSTVLHKRLALRKAFHGFDYHRVATMDDEVPQLLCNADIIRNRRKIEAIIGNAKAVVSIERAGRSFGEYVWGFMNDQQQRHDIQAHHDLPASTELSSAIGRTMRHDGFHFTGPVVIYSFLQASGMVNDHERRCFLSQTRQYPRRHLALTRARCD